MGRRGGPLCAGGGPDRRCRPRPRLFCGRGRHAHVLVRASLASAGDARRHVRGAVDGWGLGNGTAYAVEAVTGELAANAVSYGGVGEITVAVARRRGDAVTVCVVDGGCAEGGGGRGLGPLSPVGEAAFDAESGRGLAIVEALAHRWGWWATGRGGLVVWAEVDTGKEVR
ncbi:ATP-binding protein [Streptomyces sp. NPDC052225]|uniref:ATP-binding protein n=1 Tax=Streptomyces sp. NPDC052225 TaxID=3154949 RepID=UPI0034334DC4